MGPKVNCDWPNPNEAGPAPPCPCDTAPKLNGEAVPPVDVEGVTGVNTNVGLDPVESFEVDVAVVVLGVFGKPKENVGFSMAGAGLDVVVVACAGIGNALTGDVVAPNTLFLSGLGPGFPASCLGAASEKAGEVPVVVGVEEVVDGKTALWSDAPAGLFAARLNMD